MSRRIPVGDTHALVDDADLERLQHCSWWLSTKRYAYTQVSGKTIYMHQMVRAVAPGMQVDHINGDRLDNRASNLRECSQRDNKRHRTRTQKNNRSGYRGVHWHPQTQKWRAQVTHDGRNISLGLYSDPIRAAIAYDMAAIDLRGHFAAPNFLELCDD